MEDNIEDVNELDQFFLNNLVSENVVELESRRVAFEEIRSFVIMKEDILRVKSRVKWLEDGDRNTRYF